MRNKIIGDRIRKYRIMVGMTQGELAEKLSEYGEKSIAQATIAMYESGQRVPKIELRLKIADILGVDPIALSGIDLNEDDEKRLLCKLLIKYSNYIDLTKENMVNIGLPEEFLAFQKMYQKNRESLANNLAGMSEESLDYKIKTKVADEKLEFWCETELAKLFKMEVAKSENPENQEKLERLLPFEKSFMANDFERRFADYQEVYLAPKMNKEIMSELTNL